MSKLAYNVQEAAEQLSISVDMLNHFRSKGGGPRFKRIGSRIVYAHSDLEAFLASNPSFRNTSEADAHSIAG